jgi:hypothetical protein
MSDLDEQKHNTLSIFSGNSGNDYCRHCGNQLFCLLGMFSVPTDPHWEEYEFECPKCHNKATKYIMKEP